MPLLQIQTTYTIPKGVVYNNEHVKEFTEYVLGRRDTMSRGNPLWQLIAYKPDVQIRSRVFEKITSRTLFDIIHKLTNYTKEDLVGERRAGGLVAARHVFCYLLFKCAGLPCTYVAELVNRDHATVLNSAKAVENAMETDYKPITNLLNQILDELSKSEDN